MRNSTGNEITAAFDAMIKQRIGEIHIGFPGTIVSFDAVTCIATIKPALQFYSADESVLDYPLITGVPVFMPCAGNAQITYPVKAGDSCWVCISERSIDEWMNKGSTDNHDPRQYDLTDAVCFVGMCPAQSISAANVELINGGTLVSVTPDGDVNIVGNVNIQGNITCSGTSHMNGDITCDGDVTASGVSLQTHRHSGVESGPSNTGTPV
nr:MAG TPA: baseplate protein [Caudoviricetes sp.]